MPGPAAIPRACLPCSHGTRLNAWDGVPLQAELLELNSAAGGRGAYAQARVVGDESRGLLNRLTKKAIPNGSVVPACATPSAYQAGRPGGKQADASGAGEPDGVLDGAGIEVAAASIGLCPAFGCGWCGDLVECDRDGAVSIRRLPVLCRSTGGVRHRSRG